MIIWCAWCQCFVGEKPPFEDLSMTHAMCDLCAEGEEKSGRDLETLGKIRDFIQSVGNGLTAGRIPQVDQVLQRADELGIRSSDLYLGLLQPSLYEIGRRFEVGEISVAEEHRVSQFVQALIDAVDVRRAVTKAKPQVLLATVPGNSHVIGIRFLANALYEAGIKVEVMLRASAEEILQRLDQGHFSTLGISIALPTQMPAAEALAKRAKSQYPGLRLIAGGIPFKRANETTIVSEHFDTVITHHSVEEMLAEFREIRQHD